MPLEPEEVWIAAVAEHWKAGLNQVETAEAMGIDQSRVHRLLARRDDVVEFDRRLKWQKKLTKADEDEIRRAMSPGLDDFRRDLAKLSKFRDLIPPSTVTIVPKTKTLGEFGAKAARLVSPFIRNSKLCAVAWGKTLDSLVSSMRSRKPVKGLRFVPVSGQPIVSQDAGSSPSQLAMALGQVYKTKEKKRLSLHGVPARVPRSMDTSWETIAEFVRFSPDYCEIFGRLDDDASSLMGRVDMVLSGIGDPRSSMGDPWYDDILLLEERKDLSTFARGNIGGIWLPRDFHNNTHNRMIDEMNDRSLGITWNQLFECACRTREDEDEGKVRRRPGVVVVAKGAAKAGVLIGTAGLVNHYIIGQGLFENAKGLVKHELGQYR